MGHNLISIIEIVIGWKNKYATLCISHCLYHTYLLFRFDSRCHHALHTHKKNNIRTFSEKKMKKGKKKMKRLNGIELVGRFSFFLALLLLPLVNISPPSNVDIVDIVFCIVAHSLAVCVRVLMCVCIFYLVHIRWIYCCIYVYIGTHWITFVDDTFSAHHFVHKFPLFPFFFSNFVSSDVYSGKLHTRERLNQMLTNAWTIFTKQMDDWLLSETTHETKRNEKSNSIQHNKQCIFSPCTLDRQSLNNLILKT